MTDLAITNSEFAAFSRLELEMKIRILMEENALLREQIPTNNAVSTEEQICLDQLRLLRQKSDNHEEFTLDETKKFELFHKNLRLARGQVFDAEKGNKQKKLTNEELLQIAGVVG
jgi:hypothetical protein